MFELVEDPGTQLETNWELPQRPSLVDSRTPWPHLPPAIAQSQEPLAAQHFGPQQALVKIREPQQERQWTLPRGADVRFCQLARTRSANPWPGNASSPCGAGGCGSIELAGDRLHGATAPSGQLSIVP